MPHASDAGNTKVDADHQHPWPAELLALVWVNKT